jgi:hypothetical protein
LAAEQGLQICKGGICTLARLRKVRKCFRQRYLVLRHECIDISWKVQIDLVFLDLVKLGYCEIAGRFIGIRTDSEKVGCSLVNVLDLEIKFLCDLCLVLITFQLKLGQVFNAALEFTDAVSIFFFASAVAVRRADLFELSSSSGPKNG